MIARTAFFLMILTSGAMAQGLNFPGNANLQTEQVIPLDSYDLPVGIWEDGMIPTRKVEGQLTRQAWRIAAPALTTLQLLRPLREQLRNDRYQVIFECQTEACGGFDFRFAIDTLPPPDMRVSIGDFRFLTAERVTGDGTEYVTLLVSRTALAGFVEVTQIAPVGAEALVMGADAPPLRGIGTSPDASLVEQLDRTGRAVIADLVFQTGSAQLGDGDFPALQALADYLLLDPDRRVALVGHTDSAGGLEANIALSKRRAASVLERLVADHGVPRRQVEAEGVGYLAPIASNATETGREANRRVEVVVTSFSE